jgi:DNA-binding response OmpR family regulator
MNRGCNGFIQKPYNLAQLSEKLNAILGSRSQDGCANQPRFRVV